MANIKITELDAATTLASTDVVPVVDVSEDVTKKITTTDLFRTLPDGTAAAPALAFSSDAANGVYLAGTDTVGISTGGTQRVTVDGSGNVTISGDLTVSGATTTVESTTVTIDDKNIELGSVASPSNTTADGGGITLKGATDKTIKWINSTGYWTFNTGIDVGGNIELADNSKIKFGTGDDLEILHNGANSYITNFTGDLYILNHNDDKDILLQTDNGSGGTTTYVLCDGSTGSTKLNYLGSEKLQTKSDGILVQGEVQSDSLDVNGAADIAGTLTSNRVVIRDDGSASPLLAIRADDAGPWAMIIGNDTYSTSTAHGLAFYQSDNGNFTQRLIGDGAWENFYLQQHNGSTANTAIHLDTNRAVNLRYQDSNKLTTKSDGIDVTGEVQCDSLDVGGPANILTTEIDAFRVGRTGVGYGANIERSGLIQLGTNLTTGSESVNIELNPSGSATFNGSVGIGSSPSYQFHVSNSSASGLGVFTRTSGASTYIEGAASSGTLGTVGSHPLNFTTNSTTAITIDTSQNIGIGTTAPGTKLEVRDTTVDGTPFKITGANNYGYSFRSLAAGGINGARLDLHIGSSAGAYSFTNSSSELLRIDSSGRLMLGTTTEGNADADDFTVAGSANTGITIRSGASSSGNIFFSDATSGNGEWDGYLQYRQGDRAFVFATANTARLRITSAGDIFAKTIDARIGSDVGAVEYGTSTNNSVRFYQNDLERMRLGTSGGLLVGTTTEGIEGANNLTIADSGHAGITIRSGTTSAGAIYFSDATSGNAEFDGFVQYDQNTRHLRFGTAQTERLRIDSSGRVGIGVASPANTLHVYNTAAADAAYIQSSQAYSTLKFVSSTNTSSATFGIDGAGNAAIENKDTGKNITFVSGGSESGRFDSSGRVLLGTTTEGNSAADDLTIATSSHTGITIRSGTTSYGSIYFSDATSGTGEYDGWIDYKHSNKFMRFGTGATERLRITSTGAWAIEGANNYGTSGQVLTSNGNDSPTWQDAASISVGGASAIGMNDGVKINFGASNDLQIYHSGSHSFIDETGTGQLAIRSSQISFEKYTGEQLAMFTADDSCELYHNNSKKFETKTDGVDITGELQCDTLDVDGAADIAGTLNVNRIVLRDNHSSSPLFALRADDSAPWAMIIGNDSVTTNTGYGLAFYQSNDGNAFQRLLGNGAWEHFYLQTSNGSTTNTAIHIDTNRAVNLRYQDSNKLTTKSDGVDVTGEVQCDSLDVDGSADISGNVTLHANLSLQDNDVILLGSSNDLQIYHSGTNSYIADTGTGGLINLTNILSVRNAADTEQMIYAQQDGQVELYYNNSKKIETKTTGVNITGNCECDSITCSGDTLITGDLLTTDNSAVFRARDGSNNTAFGGDLTNGWDIWRSTTSGGIVHFMSNVGGTRTLKSYIRDDGGLQSASDYRLKKNVAPITGAIDSVKQLNPVTFNWNWEEDTDLVTHGFLAHEFADVLPRAVDGEKDQVKEDDSIHVQTIDQTRAISLLTAALKEAITKIETLEAKVAALEAV